MKKINYSKVMVLGIVSYIFFQIFSSFFSMTVKTKTLENKDYAFSINEKGVIIKNQEIISSDRDGYFESIVSENEKVKKGQVLGYIHQDKNEFEKNKEKIEILNSEIKKINEELQKEISSSSKELLTNQRNLKESEINKIKNELEKSIEVISKISGKVSFYYNENEKKIDLKEITKKTIKENNIKYESIYKENKKVKNKEVIAKIVDINEIFIAFSIKKDKIDKFEIGKSINLGYYNNGVNKKITCEVYDIYKDNESYTLILKFIGENAEIYNTISKEFDIIYKDIDAIKIPKSATKVINNKIGVYVVNFQNNMPNFIELREICFEDDKNFYVNYYKVKREGIKTVKIYDEIILNPNFMNVKIKIK